MSAAVAAAAAAALAKRRNSANTSASTTATPKYNYKSYTNNYHFPIPPPQPRRSLGRYELQKSRDWDTFDQYLKSHHHHHGLPPVSMLRCSGVHVVEFLRYLDQFGETKIHSKSCAFFGQVYATAACSCPLKQAWTSLDAVVSRLRAAFEEHGGAPENNPFGSPAVWLYLRQVKEFQAKARGEPFG